jgi:hypothetical protein
MLWVRIPSQWWVSKCWIYRVQYAQGLDGAHYPSHRKELVSGTLVSCYSLEVEHCTTHLGPIGRRPRVFVSDHPGRDSTSREVKMVSVSCIARATQATSLFYYSSFSQRMLD